MQHYLSIFILIEGFFFFFSAEIGFSFSYQRTGGQLAGRNGDMTPG